MTLENITDVILHAWERGWEPEETAKVLKLAGVKPDGIIAALANAKTELAKAEGD